MAASRHLPSLAALLVGLLAAPLPGLAAEHTASQAEEAALAAPVQRLVLAINHAEPAVPKDVFTQDATVTDDFAPYLWAGRQNANDWYLALVGATPKDHQAFLAMQPALSAGRPRFARIADDSAYFVLPCFFLFNSADGKRTLQNADWVMTARLVQGRWLIASHAWAITVQNETMRR